MGRNYEMWGVGYRAVASSAGNLVEDKRSHSSAYAKVHARTPDGSWVDSYSAIWIYYQILQ